MNDGVSEHGSWGLRHLVSVIKTYSSFAMCSKYVDVSRYHWVLSSAMQENTVRSDEPMFHMYLTTVPPRYGQY